MAPSALVRDDNFHRRGLYSYRGCKYAKDRKRGLMVFTLKIDTQLHGMLIQVYSETDAKDEIRYARDFRRRDGEEGSIPTSEQAMLLREGR